jgi:hypothetical protein
MNKTLKTIAWVCLVLGLLGMAVDGGALILGHRFVAGRQVAFEEMKAAVQSGKGPSAGNNCVAEDANKDGKPDGDCLNLQAPGQPGIGGRLLGRGMLFKLRNNSDGRRFGGFGILPLFFMAMGPILAVVGAVILLVNREPKAKEEKEEKEVKETKKK